MIASASYEVRIRETIEKTVWVDANSPEEAQQRVELEYYCGNIILDSDNYTGETDIDVIGPSDEEPEF